MFQMWNFSICASSGTPLTRTDGDDLDPIDMEKLFNEGTEKVKQ